MQEEQYVLAMYDIRGKQEYIYRSNRIKEIVGGSNIINDCFEDYLYPSAVECRNQIYSISSQPAIYTYEGGETFDTVAFQERMRGNQFIGEVVYSGGGNFFILFKNKTICEETTKRFTKKVLQETYSLKVLCSYIEQIQFDNYIEDQKRLYDAHRINEAHTIALQPAQVLPFTDVDRRTSMPLYKKQVITKSPKRSDKVTKENYAKFSKYWECEKKQQVTTSEIVLDNLVTEKGEESLLAIIYIDGNNMGAKVKNCLSKVDASYDASVSELRRFSQEIHQNYIVNRMIAIEEKLGQKYEDQEKHGRFVIHAGDEITFICNARDAYMIAKEYLTTLPKGHSACAGIAIFHSHTPYSEAYRIAEECCESGKKRMKEEKLSDACFIDVHYCQGAIGVDLDKIREREVGELISKPWLVTGTDEKNSKKYVTTEMIEALGKELNQMGRSNVKGLLASAKNSLVDLSLELERIKAHTKVELSNTVDETLRCMIYDVVILYDLWFGVTAEGGKHE